MPIVTNPRSIEAPLTLGDVNLVINVDENFYAVGEECAVLPHNHSHYELLFLERGELLLLIDERAMRLRGGDVILLKKGEYHCKPKDKISSDAAQYSLRFQLHGNLGGRKNGKLASSEIEKMLERPQEIFCANDKFKSSFLEIRNELSKKEFGYLTSIRAHLSIIVTDFFRMAMSNKEKNSGLFEFSITDRGAKLERFFAIYHTRKTTLSDLAQYLSTSERQAARIVKAQYNKSFVKVLTETRIRHARHELLHSKSSVYEIAAASGFASYEYFASCFKREMKMSPTEYRNAQESTSAHP